MAIQRDKNEEERLRGMAVTASAIITGSAGDKLKKIADKMDDLDPKKKKSKEYRNLNNPKYSQDEIEFEK